MGQRSADDDVLVGAMRLAMAVSVRAADRVGNVSAVQLRALTVIDEGPGVNLAQLAQAMGVTVSTTSRLVDRLVAAGLVDRRPSPQTRREIALSLTGDGRTAVDRFDHWRLEYVRGCVGRMSSSKQDRLVSALSELVAVGGSGNGADDGGAPAS